LALAGLVLVVAAGVLIVQHATRDRRYARLLTTGQQALDAGNTSGAIESFTGALTLHADSMVAYYHRGEAYRAQGQHDEAARDFRAAIRLAPEAPQPLIALGDLDDAADPAQSAVWYGQAVSQLHSEDPSLLYKLALARYRAGSPAEALEPLKHAIARNDSIAEVHFLLGLVYRDLQRVDDSMASLERAVKLAPTLLAAREELADAYRVKGRFVDEMAELQALAGAQNTAGRTIDIALAESRRGQFPDAIGTLSQAVAKSPSDAHVRLALGRVYLARAERTHDPASVTRALEELQHALAGAAGRSEGLALYGHGLALSGDDAGAERVLREAVATTPVDPEAFGFLADASERLSHFGESKDALITLDVLEGDTASADVRTARAQRIGGLALRANDVPTAIDYLSQAVNAGRKDARTFGLLAQARALTGDAHGAEDALAQALALDPRNPDLTRLKRTLATSR
jgi:tetratricopeptide (TPR) repeat protein